MLEEKIYILLGAHDEGFHTINLVTATNINSALKKLKYEPFTYPEDFEDYPEEGRQGTEEECLACVRKFYGLDGAEAYDEGNYVDGDSNSAWVILEVSPGGSLISYPKIGRI